MAVPYTFATATSSIPLSQLDTNFATAITLGNTAVYLGNTTTSIGNLTLTNTTISSVAVTFPNSFLANSSVTLGTTNVSLGGTASTLANVTLSNVTISSVATAITVPQGGTGLTSLTSGYIPYGNGTSAFGSSSNLQFNGSQLAIGTSSFATTLTVAADGSNNNINLVNSGSNLSSIQFGVNGSPTTAYTLIKGNGQSSGYLSFWTNNTEAGRFDSSGNLLVGATATSVTNGGFALSPSYSGSGISQINIGHISGSGTGTGYAQFFYNGGGIGGITQNGTTGVLYNITSDYRLKNVIGAISDSGTRIDALQPIQYTIKSDGSQHRGFLAHQFQEVYENSVCGIKDAIDDEGKPIYQQMQASTSEVIADLVAEIQSLRKRVAQLESK